MFHKYFFTLHLPHYQLENLPSDTGMKNTSYRMKAEAVPPYKNK